MAPGYSSLRGDNRPSWDQQKILATMFGAPPIKMELPQKKDKDTSAHTSGPDPTMVSHDIFYAPGSHEKYTKELRKLLETSTPEEYCTWRGEIRDLLREKQRGRPLAHELKIRLVTSCMEAGERRKLFTDKVEEHAAAVNRKITAKAMKAATEAAKAKSSEDEQIISKAAAKRKEQQQKKKVPLVTPGKAAQEEEETADPFDVPRKEDTEALDNLLDPCIWRAMNDLGLMVFDKKEKAAKNQNDYLLHNLQFHMTNKKPEKWAKRLFLLNNYMEFFPLAEEKWTYKNQHPRLLDEDELTVIIQKAANPEHLYTLKSQGREFDTPKDTVAVLTQLYDADQIRKLLDQQEKSKHKHGSERDGGSAKKRHKGEQRSNTNNQQQQKEKGKGGYKGKGYKECNHCGRPGHLEAGCWTKPENAHLAPWNKDQPDNPKKDYKKGNNFRDKRK